MDVGLVTSHLPPTSTEGLSAADWAGTQGGLATCRGPQEPATTINCPAVLPSSPPARARPAGRTWQVDATLLPAAKDYKKPAGPQADNGGPPPAGPSEQSLRRELRYQGLLHQPPPEPSATFSRTVQGGGPVSARPAERARPAPYAVFKRRAPSLTKSVHLPTAGRRAARELAARGLPASCLRRGMLCGHHTTAASS